MTVYSNILDMVGDTPMLEVSHIDTGPCRLFLKLELMNPGGLHQGPHRHFDDRAGREARRHQAGRHDCRGDGRQHRSRACAGRRAKRLPPDTRAARQDEPGEDLQPARDGCGCRPDAVRRRQGASGVLPGSRQAPRRRARARISSTSSAIPTTRWRTRRRPGPEILEQMDGDLDAIVLGVGSSGTVAGLSKLLRTCARRGARAGRSRGLCAGRLHQQGRDGRGWQLARRRHRRGFHSVDRGLQPGYEGLLDQRRRVVRCRARPAEKGRPPGRFVVRYLTGGRPEVLSRADGGRSAS